MPLTGKIPFKLRRALQLIGAYRAATLSAGETLDTDACQFQVLNPNGSNRTIVLPVTSTSDGWWVAFKNSGTSGNLIINDAAAATVATLTPGQWALVMGNAGTGWAVPLYSAELGSIDLNGTLDQDAALTGTGNAADVDFTMTHATQVASGVDVDATQLTNARTGGYLAAFRAKTTSLAADTSGVPYTGLYVLAPTDGGGTVLHSGVYVEAGNDYSVHGLDNVRTAWGTGASGVADATMGWDATILSLLPAVDDSIFKIGNGTLSFDVWTYGNTASDYLEWDASANTFYTRGAASVGGLRTSSTTAVAITGATVLTLADSGGIFTVSQGAAYDIDLPSPTTGPGCTYIFSLTAPAANSVTITVLGGAATFVGTIVNDVTSVLPATGATLTFASGAAALGDTIIIRSIATNLYHVQAVTSAAGGITVA